MAALSVFEPCPCCPIQQILGFNGQKTSKKSEFFKRNPLVFNGFWLSHETIHTHIDKLAESLAQKRLPCLNMVNGLCFSGDVAMRTITVRRGETPAVETTVSSSSPSKKLQTQILELESLIKHPPSTSKIIEFSPQLSQHILTNLSRDNRPKKPAKIKRYAQDLIAGRWGLTGDTIKFGTNGLLRDGQNRLAASVRAGRPLRSHVVFGVDPDLFMRMDVGKNRTPADVFSIAGISYANHMAGTVRWLLILTSENPGDRGAQFSNEELLDAYRDKFNSEKLEHSIQCALAVRRSTRHPVAPLAALHYLFAEKDRQKADDFFEEWAMDRAKRARAPTRYLQRRLVEAARLSNRRLHENVRNAFIIKAWNAYAAKRSLTKKVMQHSPADRMPRIGG